MTPTGTFTKRIQRQFEEFREDASEKRAGRRAGRGDGAPRPEGPGACGTLGIGGGEDRECRRGEDGRTESLHRPGSHQPRLVLRQAPEETRGREDGEAHQKDATPPEEVGGPATEEEETGEGQRVGVDHPLQARGAEVQVTLDGRQRHVHDRCVEDDHELADADKREDEPGRHRAPVVELDHDAVSLVIGGHGSPWAQRRLSVQQHRLAVGCSQPTAAVCGGPSRFGRRIRTER